MADDKKHQDNLSEEDRSQTGQMGGKNSHSGQKGGKAQGGYAGDNPSDGTHPHSDNAMKDEDL